MNITDNISTSTSQKTNMDASDNINTNSPMLILIYIVPCPIVLCIHFLALILLKRDRNFRGSQRYLIGALCCTEIVLSIQMMLRGAKHYYPNIMFDVAILFGESAGALMYFFVMTFVTLDRLAEVKLHLKYPIYCTVKRTITILILAFSITVLLFVGLLIVYLIDKTNLMNWYYLVLFYYLLTILQFIFLIIAFITYIYVFKKLHKNRLVSQKIIDELNKNPTQGRDSKKTQSNPKIFVPSFIILTFILFGIVPHYLYIGLSWSYTEGAETFFQLIPVLYFIGWCLDPIIYIFSIKSIQQTIRRCIKSPGW